MKAKDIPLPPDFTRHKGGACPVDPNSYVELAILTGDGPALTDPQRANLHEWQHKKHPKLLGAVIGYKVTAG